MGDFERNYRKVLRKLAEVRDVLRATELLYGVLLFVALLSGAITLAFLSDNLLWLPGWLRGLLLFLLVGGAFSVLLFRLILPLKRLYSDDAVAVAVERKYRDADNILVNAVQLAKEEHTGLQRLFVEAVVEEASEYSGKVEPEKVAPKERIKRIRWVALLASSALILYIIVAPSYFVNALKRYARFNSFVPPITRTRLTVEPGDAKVRNGEPLEVIAHIDGEIPETASIEVDGASIAMEFTGSEFVYRFPAVEEPFSYRVKAGDAESPRYSVSVIYLPTIERIDVKVEFPSYTGLEPLKLEDTDGNLELVKGSMVTLAVTAKQELAEAKIVMGKKRYSAGSIDGRVAFWSLVPRESTDYRIVLADFDGNKATHDYRLIVAEDEPPQIRCIAPPSDTILRRDGRTHNIRIVYRANDDVGVREVTLKLDIPDGTTKTEKWKHQPGTRSVVGSYNLLIDTKKFDSGDVISFVFTTTDGHPTHKPVETRRISIRILDPEDEKRLASQSLIDLQQRVREILRREVHLRERTGAALRNLYEKNTPKRMKRLASQQASIAETTYNVATSAKPVSAFEARIKETLLLLHSTLMSEVVKLLNSASSSESTERKSQVTEALEKEDEIIAKLRALLKEIPLLLAELKKSEEVETVEEMSPETEEDFVKKLKEGLEEFLKEQKDVIEKSKSLAKKQVEDWTEEDEQLLNELMETEAKWEKYFEDMKDDLSRLPEQDFSDSTQAKELIEIYEEVKLAEDALTRRAVEMAVPHEQAGAELAEELTENLERWMSDVHDYQKWVMEDIPEPDEIPLVDLPEELEDIVGELIDDEEELGEDVEDVSTGWADSLNKGAGWAADGGPISNMSARGITGNRMPNRDEVGGRSGEGRMGRSHGQFVEQEATGKGGRQTPTRVTPDPYESGTVKDTSKQAAGGATGGGKLSGAGKEGLRGPEAPEQVKRELQRLASQQADIAQKAERLSRNFKKLGIDTSGLDAATKHMKNASECIKNRNLNDFTKQKQLAIEKLIEQKALVADEVRTRRERLSAIPKELREEILNAIKEKMVDEYKELLKAYYRNLADEAANHRNSKEKKK